ncbi:hypothetical protein QBC33DRAFT_149620 [Phialemonium atrogriseum]|uniref:Uncharacterized protein n=1 Tax=Phialemonium atrogriseum TaxID=1093897 RepID=A0AAJ0C9C9_9PEZI|nr:uncharacterized protein QBC33DRAFT_149620 [Phialemonium atrogriseum]KAK1771333.1 hypothetical protein QBC33DRAFT_149620 [Phialemonium atrogriseum]
MAMLNPVYGLIVPFLCIFTVPLAIFAGITTTFAFSILMFRVALVYLNIAMASIPQYIMGRGGYRALPATYHSIYGHDGSVTPASPAGSAGSAGGRNASSLTLSTPLSMGHMASGYRSPKTRERASATAINTASNTSGGPAGAGLGRRSRRPSQGSATSIGSITPINEVEDGTSGPSGSWLPASSGMDRDFEGVGGWRLDDANDDADWANINSRLELPLERTPRHHHRSASGDTSTPGEGSWLMMKSVKKDGREKSGGTRKHNISPNSGRVRTGQNVSISFMPRDREEGYFGFLPQAPSSKSVKKASSSAG